MQTRIVIALALAAACASLAPAHGTRLQVKTRMKMNADAAAALHMEADAGEKFTMSTYDHPGLRAVKDLQGVAKALGDKAAVAGGLVGKSLVAQKLAHDIRRKDLSPEAVKRISAELD